MSDFGVTVGVLGRERTLAALAGVEQRAEVPGVGLEALFDSMEKAEKELFDSYGGQYVETGTLERSLTQRGAEGALREVHARSADFGSSVFYSPMVGRSYSEKGDPSPVLRLDDATGTLLSAEYMRWFVYGLGGPRA